MTVEKWLPKPLNPKSRKKRAVVYDFDGTLFKSPVREVGEAIYLEATGKELPFPGWWGRIESLSPPIIPEKPGEEWLIAPTVDAYWEDAKDQDTELILMTGRPFKNRKRVISILQCFNMEFHAHYFRGQPGQKGRDTLEIKANFITEDIMHQGLRVLEIHEDRPEHTSAFFDLSKKWKSKFDHLERITIHDVLSGEKHNI